MTIDALRARQLALQDAMPKAPAQIASPWQGAAYMADRFVNNLQQKQAVAEEASGRKALAQQIAGINPDTGATSQQIAAISTLDPDLAMRYAADMMTARRQALAQAHTDALTRAGWGEQEKLLGNRQAFETQQAADVRAAATASQQAGFGQQEKMQQGSQDFQRQQALAAQTHADAQPKSTVGQIQQDFNNRVYGDPATPEAQKLRDDALAKATKTGPLVQIGEQGSLDKELGTGTGKNWAAFQQQAAVAAGANQDMELLNKLLPMAPQGPIIGDVAKAFPGVSSAGAAVSSIINRIAPALHAPGSGSTSDIEYAGMLHSLPNLSNQPEANALIAGMIQRKAQLNIERGAIVDQYMLDHDQAKALASMAELNKRSIMTPELQRLIEGVGPAPAQNGTAGSDPDVDAIVKKYGG